MNEEKIILNKIENFILNEAENEDIIKLSFDLLNIELKNDDINLIYLENLNQYVIDNLNLQELNLIIEEYLI